MRPGALQWLDQYPPALIASNTRLGLQMLLETHHSVTATPYHRSGINFWNGHDPYVTEQAMLELADRQVVGFILICRAQNATDFPFLEGLQNDHIPDWLELMPDVPSQFLLFRVNRSALY